MLCGSFHEVVVIELQEFQEFHIGRCCNRSREFYSPRFYLFLFYVQHLTGFLRTWCETWVFDLRERERENIQIKSKGNQEKENAETEG